MLVKPVKGPGGFLLLPEAPAQHVGTAYAKPEKGLLPEAHRPRQTCKVTRPPWPGPKCEPCFVASWLSLSVNTTAWGEGSTSLAAPILGLSHN